MPTTVLPDRQQIRLLIPLGLAVTLSLAGDSTLYAVLANQTQTVGISVAAVGIMLSVNRLVRIPTNPLTGLLYDRLGRRRIFLAGLFLGAAVSASYSLIYGFWALLTARMLWGLAWTLINVGGLTMVLDKSTPANRGQMTGFYQVSYLLGLAVSPLVGGMLTDTVGYAAAMRICAVLGGSGLLVALVALPETRPVQTHAQRRTRPSDARQWAIRSRLDTRFFLVSAIYLTLFFVSNGVLMSTIGLYLGQQWPGGTSLWGISIGLSSLAGMLLSMRAALGILSGPLGGMLSDRLGSRWPVVVGGLVLGSSGFFLIAMTRNLGTITTGVMLVALGTGTLTAVVAALMGDTVRNERRGAAMGGLATAGDMGSAAGPLVAYAALQVVDLRWVYLTCALVMMGNVLAVLWYTSTRPRRAQ